MPVDDFPNAVTDTTTVNIREDTFGGRLRTLVVDEPCIVATHFPATAHSPEQWRIAVGGRGSTAAAGRHRTGRPSVAGIIRPPS